jgi:mycothiol synthase
VIDTFPDGYEARSYRGQVDHASLVEIYNADAAADQVEQVVTLADIDTQYAHLGNCDPSSDVVVVEHHGRPVAYGRTEWWDAKEGARKYAVLAKSGVDHRAKAGYIIDWLETRIRSLAASHPPGEKVFESWGPVADGGSQNTVNQLLDRGYSIVTYEAEMVRPTLEDIPVLALPTNIEVRPVEPEHLRSIWEADNEAFRDHWGFSEPTEDEWEAYLEFPHRDESLWKVAWDGDDVAGQVRSYINEAENTQFERLRGWTEFISTGRRWRRQGVAAALICQSLNALKERGMTSAALGVHVENPNGAFRLYESLGFQVVKMYGVYQKPL